MQSKASDLIYWAWIGTSRGLAACAVQKLISCRSTESSFCQSLRWSGCGHQREWYVFLPVHRTCCEPRSTGHQTTPQSPARAAAPQPAQTFKHNYSETAPKQVDRPQMRVHMFKCQLINQDFHIIPSDDLYQGSHVLYSDGLGAEYCFILLCCLCSCWQGSVRGLRPQDLPASSSSFPWGSPGRSRQMKATRPAAWPWSALGSPPAQNISTGTLLGCQNTCTGTHFSHLYLWSYSFNQLYLYNVCYN